MVTCQKGRQYQKKTDETIKNKEIHRNTTLKTKARTIRTLKRYQVLRKGSMSCSACGTRRIAHKLVKFGENTKLVVENVE